MEESLLNAVAFQFNKLLRFQGILAIHPRVEPTLYAGREMVLGLAHAYLNTLEILTLGVDRNVF